jgi:hypothetical protein
MNPLKDKQLTYWLVNLGNMYYAGGLLRKSENESSFSFEFVNEEVYAFPFLEENAAINVAKQCGGIVVGVAAATSEKLTILENRNKRYILSESQARLEQGSIIREEIRRI